MYLDLIPMKEQVLWLERFIEDCRFITERGQPVTRIDIFAVWEKAIDLKHKIALSYIDLVMFENKYYQN